jgi:hypothetical protein
MVIPYACVSSFSGKEVGQHYNADRMTMHMHHYNRATYGQYRLRTAEEI